MVTSNNSCYGFRYVKLFDAGERVEVYNIRSQILRLCKTLLYAIHIHPKVIYLVHSVAACEEGGDNFPPGDMRKFARDYSECLAQSINNKDLISRESNEIILGPLVNKKTEIWIPPISSALETAKIISQACPYALIRRMR